MNPTQYIEEAKRTEGSDCHRVANKEILFILDMAIEEALEVEKLKKAMNYGKGIENYDVDGNPAMDNAFTRRILHAALGIFGEAGELLQLVKKHLETGELIDPIKLKGEFGDQMWYQAIGLDAAEQAYIGCGFNWADTMSANISKLRARYPEKFTANLAINRDERKEEEALAA